jgi:hypothetical protein
MKSIPEDITSFNISLPALVEHVIRCINAETLPIKYHRYNAIAEYIRNKIYHGKTKETLINGQLQNAKIWVNMYSSNATGIAHSAIEKSEKRYDPNYITFSF